MNPNDKQTARDIARDNIETPSEAVPPPPPPPPKAPPASPSDDNFDPFAPENLRLDPSYLNEPVAKKTNVCYAVAKNGGSPSEKLRSLTRHDPLRAVIIGFLPASQFCIAFCRSIEKGFLDGAHLACDLPDWRASRRAALRARSLSA